MPATSATTPRRALWLCGLAGALLLLAAWLFSSREVSPTVSPASLTTTETTSETSSAPEPASSTAPPTEVWPEQTEQTQRTGVDASNFYKNAFVLYDQLTEQEKKMLRTPMRELDPEKAAALFKKIGPIMALLREAMQADYCEWGLGELSYDTGLPHITKSIDLGTLAAWSADYRFSAEPEEALTDLAAQSQLGENVADSLIGWLVQMSLQGKGSNIIRQHLDDLDATTAAQAQTWLDASTVEDNVQRAFDSEASVAAKMAAKLASKTPQERRAMFKILGLSDGGPNQAPPFPQEKMDDTAWLAAEFQYAQKVEEQMPEAMTWPREQYDAWWNGLRDGLHEQHPLAALMLPAFEGLRPRLERFQVEQTMLSAGLALSQSGPEKLAQFPDPVTGKPFTYVTKEGGFELQSTFKVRGKAVTMSFAPAK